MIEELKTKDDLTIELMCNGLGIQFKRYSYGKATAKAVSYGALKKLCQEFHEFKTNEASNSNIESHKKNRKEQK